MGGLLDIFPNQICELQKKKEYKRPILTLISLFRAARPTSICFLNCATFIVVASANSPSVGSLPKSFCKFSFTERISYITTNKGYEKSTIESVKLQLRNVMRKI